MFDLSKHWNIFFTLCKSKAGKAEPKPVAAEAKPVNKSLPELDLDIFKAAAAQRSTRKRPVVMIVEDDPFTRRLVLMALKADFDVVEAENGASAIEAYQTYAPDAAFLDIELPDTNGHIILKKLITADKGAFIVMLSANSMKENVLAALEIGAQGFVTKPFAKEKLMHYLNLCQMAHQRSVSA